MAPHPQVVLVRPRELFLQKRRKNAAGQTRWGRAPPPAGLTASEKTYRPGSRGGAALRRAHRERCPARAHFAVVCSLSCPSAATSAATARHLQVGAGRRAGARPRRVTTNEASRGRETRPILVSRHPASTRPPSRPPNAIALCPLLGPWSPCVSAVRPGVM